METADTVFIHKGMAGGVGATVTIQAPPALCALLRGL